MTPEVVTLCGFMGAGKSVVGALLARQLGYPFSDLDSEIVRREGRDIPRIFRDSGEAYFRERECEVGLELLRRGERVVALGGGALLSERLRNAVTGQSLLVYLKATPPALFERTRDDSGRPLLADVSSLTEFRALYNREMSVREPLYAAAELVVHTDLLTTAEVVEKILLDLKNRRRTKTIRVELHERSYPVHVGTGLVEQLGALCTWAGLGPKATLVTSLPLWALYGEQVQASLHDYGIDALRLLVPDGEQAKTLTQAAKLYEALAEGRHERGSPIIALGGGTVGDVAGFAAATYLRGVPLVHVPTTLLAQVDSAIGGKTGVNLQRGKNLVGAFWQPRLVLCDPDVLATLSRRAVAAGLAEVVKYACIARPHLATMVDEELVHLLGEPPHVTGELVAECVAIKVDIVAQDEHEAGLRQILNFGHTYGHALESASDYETLYHGEAVALGMLVALELSARFTGLAADAVEQIATLLKQIFPDLRFSELPPDELKERLAVDKKVAAGRSRWVLLRRLGEPTVEEIPSLETVVEATATARNRWTHL